MIIYGGIDEEKYYQYMWEFSFSTNLWKNIEFGLPPPGIRYDFRFIIIGRVAYLFGGEQASGQTTSKNNDLWAFDYDAKSGDYFQILNQSFHFQE